MPHVLAALAPPLRLRTLDSHERKVTWLELFFDLSFVAAVAQVASPLAADYTPAGVFRFMLLFLLIWWAWSGQTAFATRFDPDDGIQRLLTLAQMFTVAAMAANATGALDSRDSAGFAAAYAVLRLTLVAQYRRAAAVEASRPLTRAYSRGIAAAALLWLASALIPAPARFALWAVAMAIDLATPVIAEHHAVLAPPDKAHLPERFGLFTLILLGEALVSIMRGMEHQATWTPAAAAAAFGSIAAVFGFWWLYFDVAKGPAERPTRTRAEVLKFQAWSHAHVLLYLGLVVLGVGLEHLVGHGGALAHVNQAVLLAGAAAAAGASVAVIRATRAAERPGRPAAHAMPSTTANPSHRHTTSGARPAERIIASSVASGK
ncbi:MAG: low temperature requirement protein A [Acidobacteriota bacterium]